MANNVRKMSRDDVDVPVRSDINRTRWRWISGPYSPFDATVARLDLSGCFPVTPA
jgi:hypothetical protein